MVLKIKALHKAKKEKELTIALKTLLSMSN